MNSHAIPRQPRLRLGDHVQRRFTHIGMYVLAGFVGVVGGGLEDTFAEETLIM